MSVETMLESSIAAGISGRSLLSSPLHRKSPSPPSTNMLASHLLAAVSQVQSLTSQLPPSVQLSSGSPPLGGGYRHGGLLGTTLPQLHLGGEPPMSSLLAGLKDFPRPYHSPPPLPSSENHECKIVEYRGSKVASFIINCDTMLCLPQAFEIFLKHLVGGLHTVYTKLKRLGIEPLVCNVDQVRILRGLGAIQPGVNRCKLLSVKHFDILYRDCTTASSRPGRPPKRASDFMSMSSTPESIFEMKKRHLENGSSPFSNGHISSDMRLDKSPLLANGYHAPPHFNPLQYMANHMAGLGYPPFLPSGLQGGVPGNQGSITHPISPPESSPMKQITPETLARIHEERLERERQMILDARRGLPQNSIASSIGLSTSHPSFTHHTSVPPTSTPTSYDDHHIPSSPILNLSKGIVKPEIIGSTGRDEDERIGEHRSQHSSMNAENNVMQTSTPINNINHISNHNSSNLSSSGIGRDEDRISDMDDDDLDKDDIAMDTGDMWSLNSSTPGQTQLTPPPPSGTTAMSTPLSSTEVLLRNILGLLRVAEENARHHERQTQYEKAELKMEVLRERELRETLEKQLLEEQKNRLLMQKRCAKLKKLRRRLQERLDIEVKRRSRYEDHLRGTSPAEVLGDINGSLRKDMEAIAAELQDNLQQQREEERNLKDSTEALISATSMANLPAITASSITTSSWR